MMYKQQSEKIDTLLKQIRSILPDDFQTVTHDLETNLRSTLIAGLKKIDLVTREEFDTQSAVLQKTRLLVEELKLKITELEKQTLK